MNHIYLCPKHYKNLGNQIETKEGDCKFCAKECCCKRAGLWVEENDKLYKHSKEFCGLK